MAHIILTTKLMKEIEALAYEVKLGNLSSYEKEGKINALVDKLLRYKGLNKFALGADTSESLVEDIPGFNEYSGKRFAGSFKTAMKYYGSLDKKTGELIPFLQLFNAYWNLKGADKRKEQYEDEDGANQEAKKDNTMELLDALEAKYNVEIETKDVNKVRGLSEKGIKSVGKKYGFSEADIAALEAKATKSYVWGDNSPSNDEDSEDSDIVLSSPAVYQDTKAAEVELMKVLDLIDAAYRKLTSKSEKEMLKLMATLKLNAYVEDGCSPEFKAMVDSYLDKEFLAYVAEHGEGDDDLDTICRYRNIKRDTARKLVKLYQKVS